MNLNFGFCKGITAFIVFSPFLPSDFNKMRVTGQINFVAPYQCVWVSCSVVFSSLGPH